jgi:hypothetical protein
VTIYTVQIDGREMRGLEMMRRVLAARVDSLTVAEVCETDDDATALGCAIVMLEELPQEIERAAQGIRSERIG